MRSGGAEGAPVRPAAARVDLAAGQRRRSSSTIRARALGVRDSGRPRSLPRAMCCPQPVVAAVDGSPRGRRRRHAVRITWASPRSRSPSTASGVRRSNASMRRCTARVWCGPRGVRAATGRSQQAPGRARAARTRRAAAAPGASGTASPTRRANVEPPAAAGSSLGPRTLAPRRTPRPTVTCGRNAAALGLASPAPASARTRQRLQRGEPSGSSATRDGQHAAAGAAAASSAARQASSRAGAAGAQQRAPTRRDLVLLPARPRNASVTCRSSRRDPPQRRRERQPVAPSAAQAGAHVVGELERDEEAQPGAHARPWPRCAARRRPRAAPPTQSRSAAGAAGASRRSSSGRGRRRGRRAAGRGASGAAPSAPADREAHGPDRLVLGPAAGPGDAGDARRRRRRPARARAPSASASATSTDTAPCASISAGSTPGERRSWPRWSRRRRRRARRPRSPARSVSRAGQQPAGARLGRGDRRAGPRQQLGDLLVDRRAVVGEQRVGVALADHGSPERVVGVRRRRARSA